MLNMNTYSTTGLNRFKYGFNLQVLEGGLNRYDNGEIRGRLGIFTLLSAGTGHWPFHLFEFSFITGAIACFHITILGLCIGNMMVHDVDADGSIVGPDYRKWYSFFSCLNHQHKTLEEIVYNANNR